MSIEEGLEIEGRTLDRGDASRTPRMGTDSAKVTKTLTGVGGEERGERASANARKSDAKGPFGGLTASQAQARSAERRRERKSRAQQLAEKDALTVQHRLAYVLACQLTTEELLEVVAGLIRRAKGDGHVANAAASTLIALAKEATDDGPGETEGVAWEDMTSAQRAAARAVLDRKILELAELPETEADEAESKYPHGRL